ncbi:MAG: sulfotransferase, partial [Pseudomonadota bacterium]
ALSQAPGVTSLPFEARFAVDPDGLLPAFRALNQTLSPLQAARILARLEMLLNRVAHKSPADRLAIRTERLLTKITGHSANLRAYKEWELERHIPGFSKAANQLIADLSAGQYTGIWPGRTGLRHQAINRIAHPPGDPALRTAGQAFLAHVFGALTQKAKADVYIADETYSLFFAPEWHLLCPGIAFVHIVRDPRDVVTSLMSQRWAPNDLSGAIAFYSASMLGIQASLARITGQARLVTLRLEDLLADPNTHLAETCAALDLTFVPEVAALDFSKGHIGRWREEIPPKDHQRLCRTLARHLEAFGYDPS